VGLLALGLAATIVTGGAAGTLLAAGGETGSEAAVDTAAAESAASDASLMSQMERVGSGLKSDVFHRATSWVVDDPAAVGSDVVGGDGQAVRSFTLPGQVNGLNGIFNWIVDSNGESPVVTHQLFLPND
jgi:hypothetical protein